jgi:DNA-binding NarL/FixJ family response regulator
MTRKRISVLIVDDEPYLRRSIVDFLMDEDRYEIFESEDGETGLAQLKERMVDVCLVDMRLPGINGIEFILRAQELNPDLRYIIHTGSPEEQLPKAVILGIKGFRGVLYKPVADMMEIVHAINRAVL